jgi:hypothetical protein
MRKIMRNKKGLSTVIATVLIILLVVVSVSIVWVFVKNIIEGRTKSTASCFDVESSDKVSLNGQYTCYNKTSGEVQFSIDIGEIEIDSLKVYVAASGSSKSFTLNNTAVDVPRLRPYKQASGPVQLPGKNEGLTYVVSGFLGAEKIDSIKIAPVVDGNTCSSSSETYQIDSCSLLAN